MKALCKALHIILIKLKRQSLETENNAETGKRGKSSGFGFHWVSLILWLRAVCLAHLLSAVSSLGVCLLQNPVWSSEKKSPAFISTDRQARQPLSEAFTGFVYLPIMTHLSSGGVDLGGFLWTGKLEVNTMPPQGARRLTGILLPEQCVLVSNSSHQRTWCCL